MKIKPTDISGAITIPGGGTGATTAAAARAALGLAIGTDVQAYSAKLAAYAGGDTPSAFTLGIVDSADAAAWRSAIGAGTSSTTGTVTSVDGASSASGFTLTGGPIVSSGTLTFNISNAGNARAALGLAIGTDVQAYDADLTTWAGITPATGIGTFLATPSSANLASAITNETGSGALVFGTAPTLTAATMAGNLTLNGNWISGDGGNEGLAVDASGNVGVGTLTPVSSIGRALQVYNTSSAGNVADNSLLQMTSVNRNAVIQVHGNASGNSSIGFGDQASPNTTVAQIACVISTGDVLFRTGGTSERFRINAAGDLYANSNSLKVIDQAASIYLRQYTVATLPTAGTAGRVAAVSDALAPGFLTIIAGGGAVKTPVYDNGTNWVAF